MTRKITKLTWNLIDNTNQVAINLANHAKEEAFKSRNAPVITSNKYFIRAKNIGVGVYDLCAVAYASPKDDISTVAHETNLTIEIDILHKYAPDIKYVFRHIYVTAWQVYGTRRIIRKKQCWPREMLRKSSLREMMTDKDIHESEFMPSTPYYASARHNIQYMPVESGKHDKDFAKFR